MNVIVIVMKMNKRYIRDNNEDENNDNNEDE